MCWKIVAKTVYCAEQKAFLPNRAHNFPYEMSPHSFCGPDKTDVYLYIFSTWPSSVCVLIRTPERDERSKRSQPRCHLVSKENIELKNGCRYSIQHIVPENFCDIFLLINRKIGKIRTNLTLWLVEIVYKYKRASGRHTSIPIKKNYGLYTW